MKTLILICTLCLLVANARLFRGVLKSSEDFQGAKHFDHVAKGTVFHRSSAGTPTLASTNAHITEDIKLMLAQKLPGLIAATREIQETQADTGVLFCGADTVVNGVVTDIAFFGSENAAAGHDYEDSAVAKDGFIAEQATLNRDTDLNQCGNSKCLPDSMVAKIAGFIRSHGYHIKHSDICEARGNGNSELKMCKFDRENLQRGPSYQRAYSCPRKHGIGMQWEYDKQCGAGATTQQNQCITTSEGKKVASPTFLEDKNCTWNWVNDIGMEPTYYSTGECPRGRAATYTECVSWTLCGTFSGVPGNAGGTWPQYGPTTTQLGFTKHTDALEFCTSFVHPSAGGAPAVNQVARTIKYGQVVGRAVDIQDSVVVTGDNNCTSLRGIVLAINGNKLEEKYVLKQHEFATDYWQTQIDETKAIIETIREKITNLQGLGGYFYPLEKSGPFKCDSEFGPYEPGIDAGAAEDPKCDLAGTDYSSFQGTPRHKSMAQRSTCFCRSFTGSGDDFYLSTTHVNKTFCDTNFKEKLPSVYTFCLRHADLGEVGTWKATLDELTFSPNDVPTNLDTWFFGASAEIKSNFENSIAGQGTKCGRVSSANTKLVKFSNKGGNCVPIEGVQDIVYRLEFEFFNADAAVDRKGTGNTYADQMCVPNPSGEQILSFRQLAYEWQRIYTSNANGGTIGLYHAEEDVNYDKIGTTDEKSQFYDDDGQDDYQPFCSVDYSQLLGGGKAYTEAGVKVADPLNYLYRVNGEASYNADIITAELARVKRDTEITWNLFSSQLTQSNNQELVNKVGEKAAGHFMAILGHDSTANGFSPICATRVVTNTLTSNSNLKGCDNMQILKVENTGNVDIGTFGAYRAKNLQKTMLKSGTRTYNIKSMAFRDNRQPCDPVSDPTCINTRNPVHTILFEGDRYTKDAAAGGVTVTVASNGIDATSRCGLLCADGYYDNATDYSESYGFYAPECGTDYTALSADLAGRYCELDRTQYDKDFLSLQVVQDTTIDCGRIYDDPSNQGSNLRLMEFYLGSNCGKLTIGDLSKCPKLTHIYIHTNEDYVMDGPNVQPATTCTNNVDLSGVKFPNSLKLVWSDKQQVVDDAIAKVQNFDQIAFGVGAVLKDGINTVNDGELCMGKSVKNITNIATLQSQNFSTFDASGFADKSPAPVAAASGDESYIVGGNVKLGRFTKKCSYAKTLLLPDSIDHLADSAVLDLDLNLTGGTKFQIQVGEKLLKNGNRPDIDPFALFVDDDSSAILYRRCPTLTHSRDDGTLLSFSNDGSAWQPYAQSAEIPGETDEFGQVRKFGLKGTFQSVNYGTGLQELNSAMELITRNVKLENAYDGATSSKPPSGSCFLGGYDNHGKVKNVIDTAVQWGYAWWPSMLAEA